jgi:uncharacterized protein (UPF0335 family)
MKYIKLFESFNRTKLEEDINGVLVELVDKGFDVKVIVKPDYLFLINHQTSFNEVSNTIEVYISTGSFKTTIDNNFVYNEISDYILTLIDYVNYAWSDALKLDAIKKEVNSNKFRLRSGYLMRTASYKTIPSDDSSLLCDFSIKFKNILL